MTPGRYNVPVGSNSINRDFAVPNTAAAKQLTRRSPWAAEIFPNADRGDLIPVEALPLASDDELAKFCHEAEALETKLLQLAAV
jgi:hypothetical protein